MNAGVVDLIERRSPDVVFHLAAQADVRVSVADPVLDASINVIGALNVLEGTRRAGADKIVFACLGSTIYTTCRACRSRNPPVRPESPYGITKRVFTDYLTAYRLLHDLEFTSLALGNVYGPRQGFPR
ncbi:MAG: NAD-dependent epimerase/dehydratase family protein [Microthrixaceae bacterium]